MVEKVLRKTLKVKGEEYFANKETEILKHNGKDQEGGECVCVCSEEGKEEQHKELCD